MSYGVSNKLHTDWCLCQGIGLSPVSMPGTSTSILSILPYDYSMQIYQETFVDELSSLTNDIAEKNEPQRVWCYPEKLTSTSDRYAEDAPEFLEQVENQRQELLSNPQIA